MDESKHNPKYPLQTLSKALEILNFIKDCPSSNGVTLASVSKHLQISKSSVHRILDTLLSYGFVEKSGNVITTYRLSWAAYKVGSNVPRYHTLNSSNYATALELLAQQVKKTTTISILHAYSTIVLYQVDPNLPVPTQAAIGQHNPLYATATGKLFMLDFTNEELRGYFKNTEIKKYTPNTILNYIDFLDELTTIKAKDYALDQCEYKEDKVCIAMPVRDYTKKIVATISISDDAENMKQEDLSEIIPKLKETSSSLSHFLGY